MAKILVGTMPFVGHVTPMLPLVRELVQRGHEVRWYTGSHLRSKVEATGASYEPMRLAPDVEDHLDLFPEMADMAPLTNLKYSIKHLFGDSARGQIGDYRRILRDWPADVCFSESSIIGPAWLHELGGAPAWVLTRDTYFKAKSRLVTGSRPVPPELLAKSHPLREPDLRTMLVQIEDTLEARV